MSTKKVSILPFIRCKKFKFKSARYLVNQIPRAFEFLADEKLNFIKHHLVFSPYGHGYHGFLRFWERGYRSCLTSTLHHQISFTLCKTIFKKKLYL